MSETENQGTSNLVGTSSSSVGIEAGEPHEALFLVLTYLPLVDLLSMGAVCVSLRDTVEFDVLRYQIIVDWPLNVRLTDETLKRIARKADGRLRTLALLNCDKITDSGLHEVVEKNPLLTKLYVPECRRLNTEEVVTAVCQHSHDLKSVMVGGIFGLCTKHLEVLQSHLQKNQPPQQPQPQPQQLGLLYHEHFIGWKFVNNEFQPMIDVQLCPKCNFLERVYSCSRESCKIKQDKFMVDCWGCINCVPKCGNCGGCLKIDVVEHFAVCCGVTMCSSCWLHLPKCNPCVIRPNYYYLDYDSYYYYDKDWKFDYYSD